MLFTFTITLSVLKQFVASVPTTVYVVVADGLKEIPFDIPLFHVYDVPPVAVSTTVDPKQIFLSIPALIFGNGFTVTV